MRKEEYNKSGMWKRRSLAVAMSVLMAAGGVLGSVFSVPVEAGTADAAQENLFGDTDTAGDSGSNAVDAQVITLSKEMAVLISATWHED